MTDNDSSTKASPTKARKTSFNLEKSLDKLDEIVTQLEEGDLSLDQAMKQFELGVRLSRECQQSLQQAQQKIQELTQTDNGFELKDFDANDQ